MKNGSELHYRRTDLLGRIFMKMGQYNQALSSYSAAVKDFVPAARGDIQGYREWMEEHAPIDEAEARFLDFPQDLMAVPRPRKRIAVAGADVGADADANDGADADAPHSPMPERSLVMTGLGAILFLPLLAFGSISSFAGRATVLLIVAIASTVVVSSTGFAMREVHREYIVGAAMYFSFMTLVAFFP